MKKRLMALLLVLLICLTACDENRRPDPEDEATSFEEITPSKYIEIANKDYKGFDLYLNIYDYTEAELEQEILELLNERKPAEVYTNDDPNYIPKITAGDTVSIYYRGYALNEDGTRDYQSVMPFIGSSVGQHKPYRLTIGSGELFTGFEGGMAGKSLADFPTLELITEGEITDGLIVYVSSTLKLEGDDYEHKATRTPFRIPEDKEYIDEFYGEGLYETIISLEIGGDPGTLSGVLDDGSTYTYDNIRIEYACAPYESTGCQPLCMRFPVGEGYGELEGKEVWFEVYVEDITEYYDDEAGQGVFDDGFAEELLAEDAALKSQLDLLYPTLSPAEQIRKSIKDRLDKEYQELYKTTLDAAIVDHFVKRANVKSQPKKLRELTRQEVLSGFEAFIKEFEDTYNAKVVEDTEIPSGDIVFIPGTGPLGGSFILTISRDYVAHLYFRDSESETWEEAAEKATDKALTEHLVIHYIAEKEGIDRGQDDLKTAVINKILADFGIHIHTLDE